MICPACRCSLHPTFDARFMDADRAHFESNPSAEHYERPVLPGEHPFVCARVKRVIVRQIVPGLRLRCAA